MNRLLNSTASSQSVEELCLALVALSEELDDSQTCLYFLEKIKLQCPTHTVVFKIASQFNSRCKYNFAIDTLSRLVSEADRSPAVWAKLGEYCGLAGSPRTALEHLKKASEISPELTKKFWYAKFVSDAAFELGDLEYARSVLLEAIENTVLSIDEQKILLNSSGKLGDVGTFLDVINGVARQEKYHGSSELKIDVLIIDSVLPRYDQDAGSVLMQGFVRSLATSGYRVWFYSGEKAPEKKYIDRLLEYNVRYVPGKIVSNLTEFLYTVESEIDAFFLTRSNVGGVQFDTIRNINPAKPVIFNSVDLHFLRLERLYESSKNVRNLLEAKRLKKRESYLIRNCDASIIISEVEVDILIEMGVSGNIWQLPIIVEFPISVSGFSGRENIAFIGSYVHTPNIDAVDYFCQEIWPNLYTEFGDTKLQIIGSNAPTRWVEQYHGKNNVEIIGFVEDLDAHLSKIKCTIVPLRFGAGQKGKIATSLAHGVPCVSTEIGIEGMGLVHEQTVMLSEDESSWRINLSEVLNNEGTWAHLSKQGHQLALDRFSEEVVGGQLVSNMNKLISATKDREAYLLRKVTGKRGIASSI